MRQVSTMLCKTLRSRVSVGALLPRIFSFSCVLGMLAAGPGFCGRAQAQSAQSGVSVPTERLNLEALPAHPRLFASQQRMAAVKLQEDTVSKELKALIKGESDKALRAPAIDYPTSGIMLSQMREVQRRVMFLAFNYRLTGERKYLEGARAELLRLASLRTWDPGHFLDVAEAALTEGLGYDWLYDELAVSERTLIAHAIVTNALLPSLEVREGVKNGWVDGNFNWNQVCHGGLTVAALAIAEREPALARRIVERAIRNVPKAGAVYAPDGSYPEGPSYWDYGTSFHILLVEALRSVSGNAFGLDRLPGFLESAEFKRQMVAPTAEDYGYSDYHLEHEEEPIILWYARELHDRSVARGELLKLQSLYDDLSGRPAEAGARHFTIGRQLVFGLLWWDPQLTSKGRPEPLHWTASGEMPIAAMRSSWTDPNATYVAIKGGSPDHSHAHMDVGSFIMEADGVRWALDLGTENYDKMRAANLTLWNYAQDSTRWNTFRVGPDGHNILRFDGKPQDIRGKGEIAYLPDENGAVGNIADLRSLYAGQAAGVRRTIRLLADQSVTIDDSWQALDHATEVRWQWLTRAKVTVLPDGFLLEQQGKSLRLRASSGEKLNFSVDDVSKPRASFDSANPGVSRLMIRLRTPAGKTDRLSVKSGIVPGPDSSL